MTYILLEIKNDESNLATHFKDWFESIGEFSLLDYIDQVDPKANYNKLEIKIKNAVKPIL